MSKNKIQTATFPLIKGEVTKSNFNTIAKQITSSENPLKTYIGVKAMETVIKEVLADTTFRSKVKDDYLTLSGGSLSKGEQFGAEVATVSTLKKITLAKEYDFSIEIKALENDIANLEIELKNKKDLLKAKKLQEINSGKAVEISVDNILNEKTETDVLDTFDLKITFKN